MQNVLSALAILFYSVSTIYFAIKFFLKKEKVRKLALLFALLGFLTTVLVLLCLGFDPLLFPATNLTEAFSLLTCLMMLLFILIARKAETDAPGVILVPVTIISIILAIINHGGENVM